MSDRAFGFMVAALIAVIVALAPVWIVAEIQASNRCHTTGGHEVVTGVVVIHGVLVDQYTCEH